MAFDFPSSPTVGQQFTPVGGVTYTWNGYGWDGGSGGGPVPPQGRLTLQTLVPVMTTTQAAKTTIYYTPYQGNLVPIYNGTTFSMVAFSELSVLTTDTLKSPAAIGANKVNDWFVWNDAGTLRIGHGPDWTSDTARSAGTALVRVNGLWLNNAAITNGPAAQRGTYVGTTRSNASSQLDWIYGAVANPPTAAFFGVWNCYNRVNVASFVATSASSWTYATATFREPNGHSTFEARFVCGLDQESVDCQYTCGLDPGGNNAQLGVALDSVAAVPVGQWPIIAFASGSNVGGTALYAGNPGIGYHFLAAQESAASGAAVTFYGAFASQSGMTFRGRF
jgi:hypothetical protein